MRADRSWWRTLDGAPPRVVAWREQAQARTVPLPGRLRAFAAPRFVWASMALSQGAALLVPARRPWPLLAFQVALLAFASFGWGVTAAARLFAAKPAALSPTSTLKVEEPTDNEVQGRMWA